jgi:hypothetical protein
MTAKDIISRDTLKRLTTDLANNLLGVDGEAIELLETQNQRVEDRRADLLARMRATSGEEFLLYVEIANNNQTDMPLRMLRYYSDIRLADENRNLKAQVQEAERMLTQVDMKRLPSFDLGYEAGEAEEKQAIVRQLLKRLDIAQVAHLLDLSVDEVARVVADGDNVE